MAQGTRVSKARTKLARARFHREQLEREMLAFFGREPEPAIAEPDEEGPRLVLREPLPETWPAIIGDCLQSLRSVLEHIALELTLAHSPRADPRLSAFPVAATEAAWLGKGGRGERRRIREMSPEAQRRVQDMQPYRRNPGHVDEDPIYVLHELARIDRHQSLHLVIAAKRGTGFFFAPIRQLGNVALPNPVHARFLTKPNPSTAWTRTGDDKRPEEMYEQVRFDVVFDPDGQAARGFSVLDSLIGLEGTLDEHVLPPLERLLR